MERSDQTNRRISDLRPQGSALPAVPGGLSEVLCLPPGDREYGPEPGEVDRGGGSDAGTGTSYDGNLTCQGAHDYCHLCQLPARFSYDSQTVFVRAIATDLPYRENRFLDGIVAQMYSLT